MSFREVRVFEIREVLRLWLAGHGLRSVERMAGVDRKTVRRYVGAAVECGLDRDGGEDQFTEALMALVVEKVRPHRTNGYGAAWRRLEPEAEKIRGWLEDDDLTVVKVHGLLARKGVVVPIRTLTSTPPAGGRSTLIACIDQTLRQFGGVPTYALTDNERTVTTDHVARIAMRHPLIVQLGVHYGLTVATCVVRDPQSKGGSSDGPGGRGRSRAHRHQPAAGLHVVRGAAAGLPGVR